MKYNKFEEHIRESFSDENAEIHMDALLTKLNLPTEKSTKKRLRWMIPILLFLGVSVLFVLKNDRFILKGESNALASDNWTPKPDTQVLNENQIVKDPYIQEESGLSRSQVNSEQKLNFEKDEITNYNQRTNTNSNTSVASKGMSIKKNDKLFMGKTNDESKKISFEKKQTNGLAFSEQNINQVNISNKNTSTEASPDHVVVLELEDEQKLVEENPVEFMASRHTSTDIDLYTVLHAEQSVSDDFKENDLKDASTTTDRLQSESKIDLLGTNLYLESMNLTDLDDFPNPVLCPKAKKNTWSFNLGTEMGYSRPNKELTAKNEPSNTFFNRLKNEKTLEGIDVQLNGELQYKKSPLKLKIGSNYFRLTEQMNDQNTSIDIDTTIGIIETSISPSGDTVTLIYGEIITETKIVNKRKIHYNIHQINIPISLVYSKHINNWGFEAEVGVSLNLGTWTSGLLYQDQSSFVDLKALNYFKKNLGTSYFGRFNVHYFIRRNQSIYFSPIYIHNSNDWTTDSNQIAQRYKNVTFKIGYQIYL